MSPVIGIRNTLWVAVGFVFVGFTPLAGGEQEPGEYRNGLLVLDASNPLTPLLGYRSGTSAYVNVMVHNAPADAGGFDLIGPQGVVRFSNQVSNSQGKVVFWDIPWTTPDGQWQVSYVPGTPALSPESLQWTDQLNVFDETGTLVVLGGEVLDPNADEEQLRAELEEANDHPSSIPLAHQTLLAVDIVLERLPTLPTPLEGNADGEGPPEDPPYPGCAVPNWGHVTSHYKWVNKQVIHSPNPGTAKTVNGWSTSKNLYAFGNGGGTQEISGQSLNTDNGQTVGRYALHSVSYYKNRNDDPSPDCPKELVVINGYKGEQKTELLWGASQYTDEDDLEDWWEPSTVAGWNVKAFTLHHQYEKEDDRLTTDSAGTACDFVESVNRNLYGLAVDVSFTYGNKNSVSIGGSLAYEVVEEKSTYYEYCFGNDHLYQFNFLGGDHRYARAFKSHPAPPDDRFVLG